MGFMALLLWVITRTSNCLKAQTQHLLSCPDLSCTDISGPQGSMNSGHSPNVLLQSFTSDILLTVCLELFLIYFPWVKFLVLYGLDKAYVALKPAEVGLCRIHTVHWLGAGSVRMDEWHPCQIFSLPRMLSIVIKMTHVSWRSVGQQQLIRLFPSFVPATLGLKIIFGEILKNIEEACKSLTVKCISNPILWDKFHFKPDFSLS